MLYTYTIALAGRHAQRFLVLPFFFPLVSSSHIPDMHGHDHISKHSIVLSHNCIHSSSFLLREEYAIYALSPQVSQQLAPNPQCSIKSSSSRFFGSVAFFARLGEPGCQLGQACIAPYSVLPFPVPARRHKTIIKVGKKKNVPQKRVAKISLANWVLDPCLTFTQYCGRRAALKAKAM